MFRIVEGARVIFFHSELWQSRRSNDRSNISRYGKACAPSPEDSHRILRVWASILQLSGRESEHGRAHGRGLTDEAMKRRRCATFSTLLREVYDRSQAELLHILIRRSCQILPDDAFLVPLDPYEDVTEENWREKGALREYYQLKRQEAEKSSNNRPTKRKHEQDDQEQEAETAERISKKRRRRGKRRKIQNRTSDHG